LKGPGAQHQLFGATQRWSQVDVRNVPLSSPVFVARASPAPATSVPALLVAQFHVCDDAASTRAHDSLTVLPSFGLNHSLFYHFFLFFLQSMQPVSSLACALHAVCPARGGVYFLFPLDGGSFCPIHLTLRNLVRRDSRRTPHSDSLPPCVPCMRPFLFPRRCLVYNSAGSP